jgi:threonine synthase
MMKYLGFRCSLCGEEYAPGEIEYTCRKDQGNLDVVLDIKLVNERISSTEIFTRQEPSIWRYEELLPVSKPNLLSNPIGNVGWTPVYFSARLNTLADTSNMWIKDESGNPTGSFKDRASAVVVAYARENSIGTIVTASTGNAGAALAGISASVSQDAVIFAPKSAPPAKIAQLLVYGARVYLVDGTYDDAFDLTIDASREFDWYCRNTGYNPFTAEGKKTAAFEIWEWFVKQFGESEFKLKDLSIFVSVGDGNIISGIHKGFKDLVALGWIDRVPRIFGVQSEGSSSIANAYNSTGEEILPVAADTIADSISVDLPRDGVRALRAARETEGSYLTVTDESILQSIAHLGSAGIFAEPAGAAAHAGLMKAKDKGFINTGKPILVLNTGNGLKDIRAAMRSVPDAPVIEPSLDALRKLMK